MDIGVGNFQSLVATTLLLYCVVFKRKLFKAPKTPFQSTLCLIFRPNWSWEKVITLQEFFWHFMWNYWLSEIKQIQTWCPKKFCRNWFQIMYGHTVYACERDFGVSSVIKISTYVRFTEALNSNVSALVSQSRNSLSHTWD